MHPLISFIIPSFNFASYITSCVNSIQNQTYKNIEIVIINDGSTDNSKEVIDSLVSLDKRIVAIHKKNEGVSIARNVGIEKSRGEYVVFVDADDYLAPDYAEYMISLVNETGGEFCLSLNCFTNKDEKQTKKEFIKSYSPEDATALLLSPRIIVGSWNKIFKRSLLLENNVRFSSDLFYGEGLRFITQVSQLCTCVGIGNRKVYYYRRNNYASATSNFNIEKLYNGLKSIEEIGSTFKFQNKHLLDMWGWHKCQFCMGIVVRIISAGKVDEYYSYYKQNHSYVKRNAWKFITVKGISLYKKCLLIGCAISPRLMARLDNWRRKRIVSNSV